MNPPHPLTQITTTFAKPSSSAAALRILVAVVATGAADVWRAPLLVGLVDPDLVGVTHAVRVVVVVAGVATALGLFTRITAPVLACGLLAILGLVQRQGTPLHVHHLVWLAALIAVGDTGRAFSVDAWRARRRGAAIHNDDAADERHRLLLRAVVVVLGVVYFWPGLHKVIDAGSPFVDGDALARLVRLKSLEAHRAVPFQLDTSPSLLLVGGALVVLGELAVLPLAVWRPRLAGVVVVLLHLAFTIVLRMPYTVLAVFAVAFFLAPSRGLHRPMRADVIAIVAVVIVVGASVAGAAGVMRGWPFACYPTFSTPVPREIDELRVEAVRAGVVDDVTAALVPDDLRTPLTFAGRRVQTPKQAATYLDKRLADPRFAAVVADTQLLRVITVRLSLSQPGTPVLARRVLLQRAP